MKKIFCDLCKTEIVADRNVTGSISLVCGDINIRIVSVTTRKNDTHPFDRCVDICLKCLKQELYKCEEVVK